MARSKSPARRKTRTKKADDPETYETGTNWTEGGLGTGTLMVPFLLITCPLLVNLLAYATSEQADRDGFSGLKGLNAMLLGGYSRGLANTTSAVLATAVAVSPTFTACTKPCRCL